MLDLQRPERGAIPMRRTRFCLAGLAALLAVVGEAGGGGSHVAYAQSATGRIEGTVRAPGGAGLENVRIVVTGTTRGAISRSDGAYVISGIAPGSYRVRATRLGYEAREAPITVTADQAATLDFELSARATLLNPVVSIGYGTEQ